VRALTRIEPGPSAGKKPGLTRIGR
jgi:hypothetical protein